MYVLNYDSSYTDEEWNHNLGNKVFFPIVM